MAIGQPVPGVQTAPRAALSLPPLPPLAVAAAAIGLALVAGALIAADPPKGVAFVIALCYAPIVLTNLPVGIALWLPTTFFTAIDGVDTVSQAGALLIAVAWLGTLWRGREATLPRGVVVQQWTLALFVVWLAFSIGWAESPDDALTVLTPWVASAILFVVLVTSEVDERQLQLIVGAYVGGVALSALAGLLGGLEGASDVSAVTEQQGRLQGGSGDPNYLAAAIVPAIALACGLLASVRGELTRIWLIGSIPVLVLGLAATESRGGLLAAFVAIVVSVVVTRRGRIWVVALIALTVGMAAVWFAATPTAWERVSTLEGGNGRGSLWKVAWEMSNDHPLLGVGIGNFPLNSPDYARGYGELELVTFIAERDHVVHNVYLQLLAETGLVGIALLLALACMSFIACARAIRSFERAQSWALASLTRAVAVALAGGLAASFFISNGSDFQIWVLLALGPALLALAGRTAPDR